MAFAKTELEHKTIIGPVDKTIHDFLSDSLPGSVLDIEGENSAESYQVIDTSKAIEEMATQARHTIVEKISKAQTVFKESITSFPVVRTFRRVHQH